jgi:hypothetical protein
MTTPMKTGQVGQGAPAPAQSAEDIEAEVSAGFRAMIEMLCEDARRGNVKVTDGRDPRKRDFVDAKNAGRREEGSRDDQRSNREGQQADRSIAAAGNDLMRLDTLSDGIDKTEKELSRMV